MFLVERYLFGGILSVTLRYMIGTVCVISLPSNSTVSQALFELSTILICSLITILVPIK
jgi:hypothetical protein